jgi:hypothetical protein
LEFCRVDDNKHYSLNEEYTKRPYCITSENYLDNGLLVQTDLTKQDYDFILFESQDTLEQRKYNTPMTKKILLSKLPL